LTEYQQHYAAIRGAGADVVALSVDEPARSQAVRAQLGLEFPILSDPSRTVVRAWDLYNAKEFGGIAIPAVFVIGADLRVRYRSIDATAKRVATDGVLRFLRGEPAPNGRTSVGVRFGDFVRAFGNAIRRGGRQKQTRTD
jgi:peroxiredoxin